MIAADAHELLIEYGNEIMLLVDSITQKIQAANGVALHRLGYAQNDLIGRPIVDVDPEIGDVLRLQNTIQDSAANTHMVEARYLRANGEHFRVLRGIVLPSAHPGLFISRAVPTDLLHHPAEELLRLNAQLQAILGASTDGILLLNEDGMVIGVNAQFTRIWQLPGKLQSTVDGLEVFEWLASQTRRTDTEQQRLFELWHGQAESAHELLTLDDGRLIKCRSRRLALSSQMTGRALFFTDISEKAASDSHLKLTASVFSHAHEGIIITDRDGNIIDVNATFSRITGYKREEAIGQNVRIFKSEQHNEDFYHSMWHTLSTHGHWQGDVWNRHKSGRIYAQRLSITAIRDPNTANADDEPLHYIAFISDVTESKIQQQQLERMAHYDALTGIPNRVLFADRLHQAIAHARRNRCMLALIYIDIDGFKAVNDTYGHETGDRLLVVIAQRLRNILRENDTLARLGGDEFVAVLSDLKKAHECEAVLSRLLATAATPFEVRTPPLLLSASFGAALFPRDGEDAETLTRHADQAMYQAKQTGKNRYCLYERA